MDLFYLSEKMKYLCTLLTWQNIAKHNVKIQFEKDLVKQVESIDYQDCAPLNVWFNIYRSTVNPNDQIHYTNLKYSIFNELDIFPEEESRDIFEAALNYCIRKVNKGDSNYHDELLELYDYGLKKQILITNNELSPTSFRNICFIAVRLKKYDWTETFIKNYQGLVQEPYRENAVRYNMSRLHFYRKNYEAAMELLRFVEFDDMLYGLSSKALLTSTYYELDEYEALVALHDSFMTYLNRKKKLPDARKKSYKNLLKNTKKLANLTHKDATKLEALKKEIKAEEFVANKSWLLEKISEIQGIPSRSLQKQGSK